MTEDERNNLLTLLAEDLESCLLDRKFRAGFCVEHFAAMSDEDLSQAASEAGLDGQ